MFCIKMNPFLYQTTRIPLIICPVNLLWLRMCSGSHLVRLLICTLGLGCVFFSLCLVETDRPVLSMTELSPITSDHIPKFHNCNDTAVSLLLLSGILHHPRQDAKPLAIASMGWRFRFLAGAAWVHQLELNVCVLEGIPADSMRALSWSLGCVQHK